MTHEIWRPIPGWEGLYEASSLGRVKALPRSVSRRNRWGGHHTCQYGERVLRPALNAKEDGYLILQLSDDNGRHTHSVHALVCAAFHGPRPAGMQAAHGNGDRRDNRPGNLRWATPAENEGDKIAHDRSNFGERNGSARLVTSQVRTIRKQVAAGASPRRLAREFGVSAPHIAAICRREKWKHIA